MTQLQSHADGLQGIITNVGGQTNPGMVLVILPSLINSIDALFMEQAGPNYMTQLVGMWVNINIHYSQAWYHFMMGQAFASAGDSKSANECYLQTMRQARYLHVLITDETAWVAA